MKIDEAIEHAREVSTEQKRRAGICVQNDNECDKFSGCLNCAKEHEQLADWLEQLKEYQRLEEQGRLIKFYYCESLNEYYVGKRCDNFYYAKVEIQSNGDICLCYKWSRYLPWGKSVVDELSSWKEYTYPSEPKEICFTEWLKGWLSKEKLKELKGEEDEAN